MRIASCTIRLVGVCLMLGLAMARVHATQQQEDSPTAALAERAAEDLAGLERELRVRVADARARGDRRAELRALRDQFTVFLDDVEPAQIDQALAGARELRDLPMEAALVSAKASLAYRFSRLRPAESERFRHEAEKLHEEAISLAERSGDQDALIQVLFEYGCYWYWNYRPDKALVWLERGRAMSVARNERARQVWFLYFASGAIRLSDTASEKDLFKVVEYLERAMAMLDPERHRRMAVLIMEALGITYAKQDRRDDARRIWERELSLIQAHRMSDTTAGIHFGLAMLDLKEGQLKSAEEHFRTMLADRGMSSQAPMSARARVNLGLVLARRGDLKAALAEIERARPVLDGLKVPKLDAEFLDVTAEIAALGSNYRLAYETSQQRSVVERQLLAGTDTKRLEEMSAQFDAKLKEADNQVLRAEQAQLETRRTALALALALSLLLVTGVLYFFRMQWKQRRRFEGLAMRDELTGAPNRRSVMEHMKREFARPAPDRKGLVVGMMDIDFFKKVNDTYGHDAGDAVLKAFYKTCRDKLRPDDVLGRWGGEEFVLVTRSANVEIVFERLLEAVKAVDLPELKGERTITFSMGTSTVDDEASPDVDAVLARADEGLYAAKAAGRACCRAASSLTSTVTPAASA